MNKLACHVAGALLFTAFSCGWNDLATAETMTVLEHICPQHRAKADKPRQDEPWKDRYERAGHPHDVAPWARVPYGPKYKGYYVGGSKTPGACFSPLAKPHYRFAQEGTWGVDYAPKGVRVALDWTHGQLYQDGGGQYEPDRKNFPFALHYFWPRHHQDER